MVCLSYTHLEIFLVVKYCSRKKITKRKLCHAENCSLIFREQPPFDKPLCMKDIFMGKTFCEEIIHAIWHYILKSSNSRPMQHYIVGHVLSVLSSTLLNE